MPQGGKRPGAGAQPIPAEEKQRVVSFTPSPHVLAKLAKVAAERGQSRSMIVEAALCAYLKRLNTRV